MPFPHVLDCGQFLMSIFSQGCIFTCVMAQWPPVVAGHGHRAGWICAGVAKSCWCGSQLQSLTSVKPQGYIPFHEQNCSFLVFLYCSGQDLMMQLFICLCSWRLEGIIPKSHLCLQNFQCNFYFLQVAPASFCLIPTALAKCFHPLFWVTLQIRGSLWSKSFYIFINSFYAIPRFLCFICF